MRFFDISIIIVLLVGAVMVGSYLIVTDMAICTSDPIKYAAKDVSYNLQADYYSIRLTIYQDENESITLYDKTTYNPARYHPTLTGIPQVSDMSLLGKNLS